MEQLIEQVWRDVFYTERPEYIFVSKKYFKCFKKILYGKALCQIRKGQGNRARRLALKKRM
jgi:hypothetical protein